MAERIASNKEHPLAGVVLCFTSIPPEQRTELATISSQMGATHKFDLTSDVTHMIVGDTNTAKYKFVARERADVIILKPEWVEAVRQSWMQGEDTDVRALEEIHRLPTFDRLLICITGFEDMAFRNYIQNTATANGAEFTKDLTKTVTHLIARTAEGQKYKFATQWNVKVVSLKWFTDSLERGMYLDEELYHPLVPAEKQGDGAWNRSSPAVREKAPDNNSSSNSRPRKLRRIASAKLGDQNEGIWGDIVGSGFENAELRRSRGSQQKDDSPATGKPISIIQEPKSFASESAFEESQSSRRPAPEPTAETRQGFLEGCYFFIHGFSSKQTSVLRHHLSFNGAQLVGSISEFSGPDIPKTGHGLYTIVPYKLPRAQIPSTDEMAFECETVTDMWLERCLDAKSLIPPESHVANTPIPGFPIKGVSNMKICSTGFSRIDLLHLSKLINLIGGSYNEYLTPSASVLICNDSGAVNNDKLRHTSEWGVPAVTAGWLWASIQKQEKQPFEPYMVRKPTTQGSTDLEIRAGSRPEQPSQPQDSIDNNRNGHAHDRVRNKSSESKESGNPLERSSSNTTDTKTTHDPKPLQEKPINFQKLSPQRRSHPTSPTNHQNSTQPASDPSPLKRKLSEQSATSAAQSIDLTISGFLKQAQAANSRPTSENGDSNRTRRRKPLLGRAPSHASIRADQKGFSRASSIDTLNDDGCGSGLDSINTTDGLAPLVNSGKFDLLDKNPAFDEEETQSPPMTQLNYEDPDAVAMRKKFLHDAGKFVEKNSPPDPALAIGHVKELENPGWGSGRRTRKSNKPVNDDLNEF